MHVLTISRCRAASAIRTVLLIAAALAVPEAANADCTPLTSSASPVTNSTITCTGAALNQNTVGTSNVGYGTGNETGNTINVMPMASVMGDLAGFILGTGNTVNNSGSVTGATDGIDTAPGSTITINNLSAASTITGTSGQGLGVINAIVSNAGTIGGATDGIFATGDVTVTNSGSLSGPTSAITGNNINVTNLSGGTIASANDAIAATLNLTLVNDGTVSGVASTGVFSDSANITNHATGVIEATGAGSVAIATSSLSLNNAGTVRATGSVSAAIDADTVVAGSTNSGTIVADGAGIKHAARRRLASFGISCMLPAAPVGVFDQEFWWTTGQPQRQPSLCQLRASKPLVIGRSSNVRSVCSIF